ncbi:MAG: cupredoxin family copper-binding protein [Gemmatimonadaceae bacterium]|nr:cupredoxin family copper-binding protein [Gemmatimonadaceae bacterium]
MTEIHSGGRRALRGVRLAALALLAAAPASLAGQRLIDYTPNTRPAWTLDRWQPAMVLSHRFELVEGGDELISIPTITFGTAVGSRLALGLDYTSNSEVSAESVGGNETQWWAALRGPSGDRGALSGLLAYNTAANSVDGAITARARAGFVSLVGEARAFSDAFGTGDGGFAGALGAVFHLTEYLALAGDVGRAFSPDTMGTVWTGAIAFAFPGTRHHFSFHATNGGAVTLQGTSRKKAYGPEPVRYGFAFVAPLGTASQWSRIFRRSAPAPQPVAEQSDGATVRVNIKDLAFSPATLRIKVGQTVEWVNGDPLAHTVTADDKSWGSGFLNQGGRYSHRFTSAGAFPYHCEPHPQMKATVIVEN